MDVDSEDSVEESDSDSDDDDDNDDDDDEDDDDEDDDNGFHDTGDEIHEDTPFTGSVSQLEPDLKNMEVSAEFHRLEGGSAYKVHSDTN